MGKEEYDDEADFDDFDVCHHGVGFDEDCEDCEIEQIAAESEDRADRRSGGA